ncbi:MAG TPA: hypothetical protein VN622_01305 [Clostridia bacterium]|nr:hypothetical protein [Clostridia bacterium]
MRTYRWVFLAALIAFSLANFPILGRAATYCRFAAQAILVPATIVMTVRLRTSVPRSVLAAMYIFATWAFVTSFWSENTELTVLKWAVVMTLWMAVFVGGFLVGRIDRNPFHLLGFILVPVVLSSVVSLGRGDGYSGGFFRGYSGNSNTLGAVIAFTFPWLVFELRSCWRILARRTAFLMMSLAAMVIIVESRSRASLAALVIISCSSLQALNLGRKAVAIYVFLALLLGVYVVKPGVLLQTFYGDIVLKRSESAMNSRAGQMKTSYEKAKEGGVLGAGFGVSIGASQYWHLENFSNYSREKGNSVLAVVEETGLIGGVLYILLLGTAFGYIRTYGRNAQGEHLFVYLLSLGFFAGALFNSMFEAWILSSGPDTVVFWAVVGMSCGALNQYVERRNVEFASAQASTGALGARAALVSR